MMATAKAASLPAVMGMACDTWKQIPRFPVLFYSSRLQRLRDVEHHDVLLMMGKNAGEIMLANRKGPCFDNRLDLTLGRSALLHHWVISGSTSLARFRSDSCHPS
jgi:hypothetical protein